MQRGASCSGRLVRPFARVLSRYDGFANTVQRLETLELNDRVDLALAYDTVADWAHATGDADLGLKAALEMNLGCAGRLDYAMRSASCLLDAVRLGQEFGWQISESLRMQILEQANRAVVRIVNDPQPPRAITDFTLGSWFRNHFRPQLDAGGALECFFSYPQPPSVELHRVVFAGTSLIFDAGFDGFALPRHCLYAASTAALPELHAVHCELVADSTEVSRREIPTTARVRELLASEVLRGQLSSTQIAQKLGMSRRTLVRRLALEGTTYSRQVSDVRRALALRYARTESVPIARIPALLGYSPMSFFRRFKDWTGTTPQRYRKFVHRN